MKTLHLYLTRQMLATLGMTVFVFTLLLILGNFIKEILQLIIHRQATIGLTFHALALLVPYSLGFSLPIGMLTAALLVFGRFSADQELTAARASGISLISLISPVLLLSVAVSALCAWINMDIGPTSRMAFKELIYHAAVDKPANWLESNEATPFGNYTIYVGKVHEDHTNLESVIVSQYDQLGQVELLNATTGTIVPDLPHHQIILTLQNETGWYRFKDGWQPLPNSPSATYPIGIPAQVKTALPLPLSDMTFRQLCDQRAEIKRKVAGPEAAQASSSEPSTARKELKLIAGEMLSPVLVYMHRAISFSFACIGFTLVGIPLGIRGHRRETSIGVAIGLVLMLVYYSFIVLGQAWAEHPERAPYLIVWLPNFIFEVAGVILLWRANRGL